jgi:RNA polymerase sigma-70 factor, ECF subfamily
MNETLEESTIDLVIRARSGDRAAFDALVVRMEPMVFAVVLRRLRNRSEALEVTQDVFIQVLRKLAQLRDLERFEPWIRKIAVRLAINRAVRRPREFNGENIAISSIHAAHGNPLERIVTRENADTLRACLSTLRDLDRRTLVAFYFEGRSLQEMSGCTPRATACGISWPICNWSAE